MKRPSMRIDALRQTVRAALLGPQLLAFVPAMTLAGYWLGGEPALVALAVGLPVVILAAGSFASRGDDPGARDPVTGLPLRPALVAAAETEIADVPEEARTLSSVAVAIDEFDEFVGRYGDDAGCILLRTFAGRLRSAVRDTDLIGRLEGPRFLVLLRSGGAVDLEALIQLSTRVQRRMHEPVPIDGASLYATVSVGFCTPRRSPSGSGEALVSAAERALDDAQSNGAGAIRAFTREMQRRARSDRVLSEELPRALENGEIVPWFQPQIRSDTGEITGLEALARWAHPENGLIPPAAFLPAIEELGLMERLGEVMLYQGLNAMRTWEAGGCRIPNLSLNFSGAELRNPNVVDRIRWELDRFDLAPERLTIEVLETVVAQTENDTIIRSLRNFAELGCRIDLDDFGTGHASIASIRRFSVGRIKIDRSFVTQIDSDTEQQSMVSAIITLAEKLGLETLGEGVENSAEHAALCRLGCGYIQGFGIARPMPYEKVQGWVEAYNTRLAAGRAAQSPKAFSAGTEQGKTA